MIKQLYWEDVQVGNEVTTLPKIASTQTLVKWAAASSDFNPLHYDAAFAEMNMIGKPIVHGGLKRAWLINLMTDWVGDNGTLKKLSCQYRGIDYPRGMKSLTEPMEGETWLCKGKVTKKYEKDGEHYVDCDIWVENAKGEKTTPGTAIATLPSRGKMH